MTFHKYSLFTLFVALLSARPALSQGAFLESGQSGFGAFADLNYGRQVAGGGITLGYSSMAAIDVDVSLSYLNFLSPYPFYSFSQERQFGGTAVSLIFVMHVLRQNSVWCPLSASLSAGCSFGSYSAPANSFIPALSANDGYHLYGGTIYRNIDFSPGIYLQPSIGLEYREGYISEHGRNYGTEVTAVTGLDAILGATLAVKNPSTGTVVLGPAVMMSKRKPVVSANVGLIFGVGR